ncbi:MAG: HEAT repeat domain-containing protein [Planctomycetota bacterium]
MQSSSRPWLCAIHLVVFLATVLAAFLSSGCSTGDNGRPSQASRGAGGGLWQDLDDSRSRKENRVRRSREKRKALDAQIARGRAQVPAATRNKMEVWWKQFLAQKPAWERSRRQWHALGPRAKDILVENLLIVVVRAYEGNQGILYKRARAELFEIKKSALPYLVAGLSGTYGDDVIRKHCIQMLSDIGRESVAPIRRAYDDADDRGRIDLLKAVSAMGEHGAPESVEMLAGPARNGGDFKVRLVAIEGLGASRHKAAVPVLLDCLKDSDVSVRKFAAAGLSNYRQPRVASALIAAMARAERARGAGNREQDVVTNCRRSLRRLTGKGWKTSRDWSAWWKTQRQS